MKVTADLSNQRDLERIECKKKRARLTWPLFTMGSIRWKEIGLRPPIMKWLLAVARGTAERRKAAESFEETMLGS